MLETQSLFGNTEIIVTTITPPREHYIAYLEWRIYLQVAAVQYHEMVTAQYQENETWKKRILETLCKINEKAQIFNPTSFPMDIVPPTAEYLALSAMGENWLDTLTRQLTSLFLNVPAVDTTKIN